MDELEERLNQIRDEVLKLKKRAKTEILSPYDFDCLTKFFAEPPKEQAEKPR